MTQPPQWGARPHQPPPGHGHQPPPRGHHHQPPAPPWPQHARPQPGPPQGFPQQRPPQQWPQQQWPQQQWPQQQWPQQQWPHQGHLPPRPSQLTLLAVLNWLLATGMLAIAAFVIISFLVSGGTLLVGILLAAVVAGFGVLNVMGALSINHPHFPNTIASQMAGVFTGLVLLFALVRSLRRGVAELVPSLASAVLLAVCVLSFVLATRPAVKQWILAKHQHSLSQGHRPRARRR